jgi:hypothetical protein
VSELIRYTNEAQMCYNNFPMIHITLQECLEEAKLDFLPLTLLDVSDWGYMQYESTGLSLLVIGLAS